MRKLNKEKFLKTELGEMMQHCIIQLELSIQERDKCWLGSPEYEREHNCVITRLAEWQVFKIMLKQFFDVEYSFTRTDEYFGLCTEDGKDWLIKYCAQPCRGGLSPAVTKQI